VYYLPPIPQEYWIPLYGIIVSTIVGWSIPSIIGWTKSNIQGRRVHGFHKSIGLLYTDGRLDESDIANLDAIKGEISNAYAKGKITDQHYANLKDEISVLYEEIYKKKIDAINKYRDDSMRTEILNNIKEDITDAYAKGKLTDQHYSLLNAKISL
jgi:uncharacterized membrane protein